jgi:putative endonuclease
VDTRGRLGEFGEEAAANYLARAGHQIVARRWRCRRGELDIVTQDGQSLVFVEVRTRRGALAGSPEESVNATKRARLVQLAYSYLAASSHSGEWRIDVVAVEVDRGGRVARINHIPHAVGE